MSTLYNKTVYAGTTDMPYPAPVLDGSAGVTERLFLDQGTLGTLPLIVATILPDIGMMLFTGFFGDYFNKVYVVYNPTNLINPVIGYPNRFFFWNTNFSIVSVDSYDSIGDVGLTIDTSLPLSLNSISISFATITVDETAPDTETANYTFHISDGSIALWTVFLLEAILQLLSPETPVVEVLKWKTVVDAARDGTEQRTSLTGQVRTEHNVNFMYLEDSEQKTVFEQLVAEANQNISYPIWTEQTRLLSNATIGDNSVQIDTSKFDLVRGDQIIFTEGHGDSETADISSIGSDGTTVNLVSGLRGNWDSSSPIYRVTTVLMQDKPSLERQAYGLLRLKATMRFTEYRRLFEGDAAAQEIVRADVLADRLYSSTVYTLDEVPILNARPIVTDAIKEDFDWSFEIIDYEFGPFSFITDRNVASVTFARKFHSTKLFSKFYWNYVLNWCQGRRRPVWLPTWMNEVGPDIKDVTGSAITMMTSKYFDRYPFDSAFRGLWIAYGGGWLPRKIISVANNGHGETVITIDKDVPDDFPTDGPWEVSFMILARQATDEVQREWHPAYNFLTTSFVGTKSSPEIT